MTSFSLNPCQLTSNVIQSLLEAQTACRRVCRPLDDDLDDYEFQQRLAEEGGRYEQEN